MTLTAINRTPSNVDLKCQKATEKKTERDSNNDENINQHRNIKKHIP